MSTTSEIFRYNRTYGSPPSNITNAAWAALFPEQGGFFKHPSIAPDRSAFSVFHQLHCLVRPNPLPLPPLGTNPQTLILILIPETQDGIRQGYWSLYHSATSGQTLSEEDFPFMSSPPHIRHCIDLLRQSLMCRPDMTVEVKNEEVGGVTGFGTEHRCRDWGELRGWMGRWEGWMQDPHESSNETYRMHHHGE